ncbi:MAG: 4Fe-4S double cluster binding domain-containing protein, partial [Aquihabitans sp.]
DRAVAERAGLGWYGKNANLLLPGRGSWFILGSVLTDAGSEAISGLPDSGPQPDGCGSCVRCIDACPTGAIIAPGVVDARRCLSWTLQAEGSFPRDQRVALGARIYGCDDCQEVCPPNRRELLRAAPGGRGDAAPMGDPTQAWVPVLGILAATDAELLASHGRWYIAKRDPRYLRRNALVVLGNIGDGADPQVRAALVAAIGHLDPVLRSHAAWAAKRLGCDDLLVPLLDDPDPEVQAELAAETEAATKPGVPS